MTPDEAEYLETIENLDEFLNNQGRFVQTDSNEQAYGVIRALDGWNPRVNIVTEEYFPEAIAILAYIGDPMGLAPTTCPPGLTPNAMETMAFDVKAWMNKLDAYPHWETAWWREVIQNASDARGPEKPEGADRVDLECYVESYTDIEGVTVEAMRVSATDNGVGMSEEVLRNAFLAWSGSHKPEGSTGGFGDAKELIIIPWLGYEIHTRDRIAHGRHNQFEITPADRLDGTRVTTWMPLSKSTTEAYAHAFIDRCFLPKLNISINGKRRKADLTSDDLVEGFPKDVVKTWYACKDHPGAEVRWSYLGCPVCASRDLQMKWATVGTVRVYHNPRTRRRGVLVRSNGIYMFDRHLDSGQYKGVVLIELDGAPKNLFDQKRNGFSALTDVEQIVDQFIARLTVDVRSALNKARSDKGKERMLYGGTGAIEVRRGTAAKVAAEMAMDAPINEQKRWKDGSVSFDAKSVEKIAKKVAEESKKEVTEKQMEDAAPTLTPAEILAAQEALARSIRNRPEATTVILKETRFASPEHAADALKLMAWQPMFLLVNKVDFFNVPADLRPEKMKSSFKALAELWMEICRFTLLRLGWSHPFGVGWIFAWDSSTGSTTLAAHTTDKDDNGNWFHFLLLNPVKLLEDNVRHDKNDDILNITYKKQIRWKATDDETVKMLCAIAVHECTHMVNGIGDHNEAFTSAMTENMGALMDMLPVAQKIRTALASGAREVAETQGPSRSAILKRAKELGMKWEGPLGDVPGWGGDDRFGKEYRFDMFEDYGTWTLYDYGASPPEVGEFSSKNDARFAAAQIFVEEQGGVAKRRTTPKPTDDREADDREVAPKDTGDPMFARLWILFLYAWARHPEAIKDSTYEGQSYARSLASEIVGSGQKTSVSIPTAMQQMIDDPTRYTPDSPDLPIKLSAKSVRDLEWDGREAWNIFVFTSKAAGPMEWDDFERKRLVRAVGAIYDLKMLAKARAAA